MTQKPKPATKPHPVASPPRHPARLSGRGDGEGAASRGSDFARSGVASDLRRDGCRPRRSGSMEGREMMAFFWACLRRRPQQDWCRRCKAYQRASHRHWILDKDDPQWDGHQKETIK